MERLVGKYCKIVTKEPGEERASVVTGYLEDVDYKDGFILVDSNQGLGCLRINTIIAIKPGKNNASKRPIKEDVQAMVGIGTLIIFIAMVLIAAVAAGVLINTSETLQSRAKAVGVATIREVSAGIAIDDVTGYTNENRTKIEYLALTVRPRAGSQDIDLSLITLNILYNNLSVLKLNTSLISHVNTDGKSVFDTPMAPGSNYSIFEKLTATEFGVIAIHDPDESVTRTAGINSGDRIMIVVNLKEVIPEDGGGLPARQKIGGSLLPEIGIYSTFDATAPAVFSNRIVYLS